MSDQPPPGRILGDTEPTPERIQTARRLLELHARICVPEPECQWCLVRYPCADAAWAIRVRRRAQLELGIEQ